MTAVAFVGSSTGAVIGTTLTKKSDTLEPSTVVLSESSTGSTESFPEVQETTNVRHPADESSEPEKNIGEERKQTESDVSTVKDKDENSPPTAIARTELPEEPKKSDSLPASESSSKVEEKGEEKEMGQKVVVQPQVVQKNLEDNSFVQDNQVAESTSDSVASEEDDLHSDEENEEESVLTNNWFSIESRDPDVVEGDEFASRECEQSLVGDQITLKCPWNNYGPKTTISFHIDLNSEPELKNRNWSDLKEITVTPGLSNNAILDVVFYTQGNSSEEVTVFLKGR
ncbi:hypothetical protein OVS_04090 [Mycoplasma ovis str. Michigan]|uniref:Uncharacterized protein n=1 Tax=Mycoplasma ovis str. Michigan TaxID=1415773 RepID=A0ABN4BRM1_9MOLU|nr:hypothetical protein OVS_04090 [Mycoplasma ovis str. Michigan]